MIKINKAAKALLLGGLFAFAALCGCADNSSLCEWALTPIDDVVCFHTELQHGYLADDYNNISEYAYGVEELSRPQALKFEWKATPVAEGVTVKEYVLEISPDSDFDNVIEYRTEENYGNVYNLRIATEYFWRVQAELSNGKTSISSASAFCTEGDCPRNLYVDGITNVRDLGGWETGEDLRVPQGLIFRCGRLNQSLNGSTITEPVIEITDNGKDTMLNTLGVRSEIDLRLINNKEYGLIDKSPLGEEVGYYSCPMEWNVTNILTDSKNNESIKKVFSILADKDNYPVIYHCNIGTDRTGLFAYLLNGLLGVSEEDLYRDYLFSNFGNIGGSRNLGGIQKTYIATIKASQGETLSDKIYNTLVGLGVLSSDLDSIKEIFTPA